MCIRDSSQGWSYRWSHQLIAANGYIVILPNRRGTTAFGQEWTEQISGDYTGQNMQDYLSAVDHMKREPFVDGSRIAAVGASYGGYSVFHLAGTHNERFAAFIAHAGIFNTEHTVSYTHLRAHETVLDLVCRLLLEKKIKKTKTTTHKQ